MASGAKRALGEKKAPIRRTDPTGVSRRPKVQPKNLEKVAMMLAGSKRVGKEQK